MAAATPMFVADAALGRLATWLRLLGYDTVYARGAGIGELIERSDRGRWMIFAAYLGNGIAAYRLSEHFRNVDRRDTEASRFLNLARANNYAPPRQLEAGR